MLEVDSFEPEASHLSQASSLPSSPSFFSLFALALVSGPISGLFRDGLCQRNAALLT